MPDEVVTPAEGANEGGNAEVTASEAPASAVETTPSAAPATTAEPSPSAASEPDIATLLSKPELRKQLFSHPDLVREIEHRAASEAGRRAKAEMERWQQQEQARQERERLKSMDEYELGAHYKQQLSEQEQQEEFLARLRPLQEQYQLETLRRTGAEVFASVQALAKEAGATDEEMAQLNPMNYSSLGEYVKGAVKFMGNKEGKKLSKEMAKVEAAAQREAERAAERETTPGPDVLPPGEGVRTFTREDLASMSPEDYRQNRDRIWEQLSTRR